MVDLVFIFSRSCSNARFAPSTFRVEKVESDNQFCLDSYPSMEISCHIAGVWSNKIRWQEIPQEIPLYNNDLQNTDCFSQTHIIPQSRNIQASRGTNLTYPTQTGNFAGNFPSTKSQAVHRPQIQQPFLEVQCSWSYFGYGHWVFRK